MRIRSEWVTLVTVTGLAVCALMLPKHAAPTAATPIANHDNIAAAGIDYTPVGSAPPAGQEEELAPPALIGRRRSGGLLRLHHQRSTFCPNPSRSAPMARATPIATKANPIMKILTARL